MTTWPASGSTVSRDWVRRYVAFLGVDHPRPSASALARLTRAHLHSVPFENVTSLLRRRAHPGQPVPPVEPETLLGNWEQRRGGGLCFEVAESFGRLLAALGYRVHPVLGYISFPGSHQALLVELDGERRLVDVACGAPFFEPIPLDRITEIRRAGLAYRFQLDEATGDWRQDRRIDGAWVPFCRYALRPPDPSEREAAYQRHHTPGESWVVGTLTLIRCEEEQVFVLRDEELSHFTNGGKRTERVSEPARYAQLASEVFRLPALPIADGLAAWRELTPASPGR